MVWGGMCADDLGAGCEPATCGGGCKRSTSSWVWVSWLTVTVDAARDLACGPGPHP